MTHVLIGFAEAVPAAEVVFSLLDAGHRVSLFARSPHHPIRSLPIADYTVIAAPEEDFDRARQQLRVAAAEADVVFPMDDVSLLLTDAALDADAVVAGARGSQAAFALNKSLQIAAARKAGLDVLETSCPGAPEAGRMGFPLIAKPAEAVHLASGRVGKRGATYLHGSEDLGRLEADPGASGYLLQPLVHGTGEGVFGYAGSTGVYGWSGHRRLRMMNPHGSGSSACAAIEPAPGLRAKIEDFLKLADWRGPFMMEFLRDDVGTPWFMEMNGRMWGSLALARRQGFEYPQWAVSGALDPAFVPASTGKFQDGRVARHLGRELAHLAFVARGPKSDFYRASWPGLFQAAASVLRPSSPSTFYNYDRRAPAYVLREAAWMLRRLGRS